MILSMGEDMNGKKHTISSHSTSGFKTELLIMMVLRGQEAVW